MHNPLEKQHITAIHVMKAYKSYYEYPQGLRYRASQCVRVCVCMCVCFDENPLLLGGEDYNQTFSGVFS